MIIPKITEASLLAIFEQSCEITNLSLSKSENIQFDNRLIIKGATATIESLAIINLLLEIERLCSKNLNLKIDVYEIYRETSFEIDFQMFSEIIFNKIDSNK